MAEDHQPPSDPAPPEAVAEPTGGGVDLARAMLVAAKAQARSAAHDQRSRGGGAAERSARRRTREANLAGSGSGPDDRDPQPLAATVQRLVVDRGWEVPVAVGGVLGRWAEVVGSDLAAHCTPEGYEDGVLTVRAESTAWATQVRMLLPTLLRRLHEELGDGAVTRVVVLGPGAPSWRRGRLRVAGRGPRDTYG